MILMDGQNLTSHQNLPTGGSQILMDGQNLTSCQNFPIGCSLSCLLVQLEIFYYACALGCGGSNAMIFYTCVKPKFTFPQFSIVPNFGTGYGKVTEKLPRNKNICERIYFN